MTTTPSQTTTDAEEALFQKAKEALLRQNQALDDSSTTSHYVIITPDGSILSNIDQGHLKEVGLGDGRRLFSEEDLFSGGTGSLLANPSEAETLRQLLTHQNTDQFI